MITELEQICPMCGRRAFRGITHPGCRSRYGIDGLTSFFHYGGPVQQAIKELKYRFVTDLAREFVSLIPDKTLPEGTVVPMPLHWTRQNYRGFNQADVLARHLNRPLRTDILARTKATAPQADMKTRRERLANMPHIFIAKHSVTRALLFDDVFTTGATMRSAANTLKHAGASFVWAVTMAR